MARIGIDIDGVLADFNSCYTGLMRDILKLKVPMVSTDYPDQWNYHRALGVTEDQERILFNIMEHQREWVKLRHYADVPGFANWYATNLYNHDIYFITSRPDGASLKEQTESWLAKELSFSPRPLTVLMASDKGRVAKALKLDYFIEDKPETLDSMPEGVTCFLVDRPWNRHAKAYVAEKIGGIVIPDLKKRRVSGIAEAVNLIDLETR